jgi:chromosome partitioning protein
VIAVTNQKGGVGKTTTAINLGAALALAGYATLVVDVDPQANATSGLGLKALLDDTRSIYQALMRDDLPGTDAIIATTIPSLHVLPATRDLAGAEIELIHLADRERRLRALVEPLRPRFRFILIDSPPSLGLLTLNALVAADAVLIPLHCEYFALEGLADLIATLRRVRAALNPGLDIEGVLLTMNDERTNLGQQVARDVREYFRDKVYRTVIPRNVRLAEAPSHGQSALTYDPKSRGAEAYQALAREILASHQLDPSAS